MKKLLLTTLSVLFLSACEYVPTKVFEIQAMDGTVIKLACPVVDGNRSELTYVVDSKCVIYK